MPDEFPQINLIMPPKPRPVSGAPLPEDIKAQATLLARAITQRACQHTGKQLYPRAEHIQVTGLGLTESTVVLHLGFATPGEAQTAAELVRQGKSG